jgi:hypothetical protein
LSSAVVGSIAIRTDINKNYVLSATPSTTLSNWLELSTPTAVTSVNNATGPNVVLTTNEIAEGANNKYYTDTRARNAISATTPLSFNSTTGTISMTAVSGSTNGYLNASDYNVFNNKQNAITAGVDYLAPNGSAALLTNFPTLNQSTTGNAATSTKLATSKTINGIAFDGSSNITIAADANTLTGTSLASNIVSSNLTSVGTITSGVWSGTTIAIAEGGTGATTASAALTNLGAEPTLNKSVATDLGNTSPSDILFPSQKAVKIYVDMQSANAGVADGSITNAKLNGGITYDKLAGNIPASKLVGTDITTVGTITSGVWSGTAIDFSKLNISKANITGLGIQETLVAGTDYIIPNASITGATKTKITYDTKGLVTAGADANTSDIAPSTNRNYVTDAQAGIISNTSGTNTGDETATTIKTKLGISTLSGANTGDQTITLTGNVTGSGNGSFATTVNSIGGVSSSTIATLPTSIASNIASITANTNSIATLTNNVNANTASITSNTNNINSLSSSVNTLNGNVSSTINNYLTTLPNLSQVGTITSGTWSGTVIGSNVGGAGSVNGILKANGNGVVSAATAGTDFQTPITAAPTTGQFLTSAAGGTYTWTAATSVTGVPYTGATGSVNLGAYDINATKAKFIGDIYTTPPSPPTATYAYDNTNYQDNNGLVIHTYNQSGMPSLVSFVATGKITGNYSSNINFLTRPDVTNGVPLERLRITRDGKVGIGTTAPTATLDVVGSGKISTDLFIGGTITSGTWSGTVIGSNRGGAGLVNGLLQANGSGVVTAAVAGTDYQTPLVAGTNYLVPNAAITGATKTKITYDAKGLVTAGADATTADIVPSTNRNYVTDIQAGVISNTSGTNTGDQTITLTGDVIGSGTGNFATTINSVGGVSSNTISTLPGLITSNTIDLTTKIDLTQKGANNGVATLGNNGKIPSSQIPAISFQSVNVVVDEATMLGLSGAVSGSVAIRTDLNKNYVLSQTPASTLSNWVELATPNSVTSVNGYAGPNVILTTSDVATSANKKYVTDIQSFTLSNTSGVNTGDQTITLTGDVTGSGTGSFATTINTVGGISASAIATLPGLITTNTNNIAANTTSINGKVDLTQKGANNGVATLGNDGKIPSSQIPAISFQSVNVVANQNAMLALSAAVAGSVVVRTDVNKNYVLSQTPASTLSNWIELATPNSVTSVNGYAGPNVILTTNDVATSANKNYVTDVQSSVLSNTSGINTGDETIATIKTKLGISTLSGSNTGDQTITLTGDMTGTGTGTFTSTLTNTGVTAASYGSSTTIPSITVDSKGRITAATNTPITAVNSLGTFTTTSYAAGGTISGTTLTLSAADETNPGLVSTSAQTFVGSKTFSSTIIASAGTSGNLNSVKGLVITPSLKSGGLYTELVGLDLIANLNLNGNESNSYATGLRVQGANMEVTGAGNDPTNVAIGRLTMQKNTKTSGGANTSVGYFALGGTVTGTSNTAIGANSMIYLVSGNSNTAVGESALRYNVASNNTALGSGALYSAASANNNIGIGKSAGSNYGPNSNAYTATSGEKNIFIGTDVRPLTNTDSYEIVIGSTSSGTGTIGDGTNTTTIGAPNTTSVKLYGSTWRNNDATAKQYVAASDLTIKGQDANVIGYGGGANNPGGSINLTPGQATGTEVGGSINLNVGSGTTSGTVNINGQVKITGGTPGVGKVLTSDANGLATWATAAGGSGVSTLTYTTATSYANGGTISGTTLTLSAADVNNPGLVSTGVQTFAGAKTFSNTSTFLSDISINGLTLGKGPGAGLKNTVLGYQALQNNAATGTPITAIGYQALQNNNTGYSNTALGSGALSTSNNGTFNTAVGFSALENHTGGNKNTGLGMGSLQYITSGDDNVAVGMTAARVYGAGAGTNLTSASQGVYIGSNVHAGINTVSNEIAIGYNVVGNGSNSVTIGNSNIANNYFNGNLNLTGQVKIGGGTPGVGKVLTSDANGLATWVTASAGVSTLTYSAASSYANGGTISGTTLTLSAADVNNPGLVSTGAQTFAGAKTFTNTVTFKNITFSDFYNIPINGGFSGNTGQYNIGLGWNVLNSSNTGNRNIGVGYYALNANTSGINNNAIGYNALALNTSGNNNVAMGYTAMNNNTGGDYNTSIGYTSLSANTTGNRNTVLGANAMSLNTTNGDNTAVGYFALHNSTGGFNDAFGSNSLGLNTSGTGNVAFGMNTISSNTTGNYNTAIGGGALGNATTSPDNVAVGNSAGSSLTTDATNTGGSILIGKDAGRQYGYSGAGGQHTTGYNNILIGKDARSLGNGDYNEIVISPYNINNYYGGTSVLGLGGIGGGSNTTTIGNTSTTNAVIYGSASLSNFPATATLVGGATGANGGDFVLKAQSATGAYGNGGNIVLTPGTAISGSNNGVVKVNGSVQITGGTPGLGKVLTSDASGVVTWIAPVGVSSLGAFSVTSNAKGGVINGTTLTLSAADETNPGLISTSAQTIVGTKTFSSTTTNFNGQVKIADGTQAVNKVLVSDANGLASWANPLPSGQFADLSNSSNFVSITLNGNGSTSSDTYLNSSITLPVGKWDVIFNVLTHSVGTATTGTWWIRMGLSTSSSSLINTKSTVQNPTDFPINNLVSGRVAASNSSYDMIQGHIIINNTSGSAKTYYLWTSQCDLNAADGSSTLEKLSCSSFGENLIFALPIY